ncbi:MAG: hypothetical protein ACYCZZ_00510 [Minisyncoccota bacterium]
MYVLVAETVALFWIVGVVTGMVSVIFLLELEGKYILQPAKHFVGKMKMQFARIASRTVTSSKKVFQSMVVLNFRKTIRAHW